MSVTFSKGKGTGTDVTVTWRCLIDMLVKDLTSQGHSFRSTHRQTLSRCLLLGLSSPAFLPTVTSSCPSISSSPSLCLCCSSIWSLLSKWDKASEKVSWVLGVPQSFTSQPFWNSCGIYSLISCILKYVIVQFCSLARPHVSCPYQSLVPDVSLYDAVCSSFYQYMFWWFYS